MRNIYRDTLVTVVFDTSIGERMQVVADVIVEGDVKAGSDFHVTKLKLMVKPHNNGVYNPCGWTEFQTTKAIRLTENNDIREVVIGEEVYRIEWDDLHIDENINQAGGIDRDGTTLIEISQLNMEEYLDRETDKIEHFVKGKCYDLGIQYSLDFIYPKKPEIIHIKLDNKTKL